VFRALGGAVRPGGLAVVELPHPVSLPAAGCWLLLLLAGSTGRRFVGVAESAASTSPGRPLRPQTLKCPSSGRALLRIAVRPGGLCGLLAGVRAGQDRCGRVGPRGRHVRFCHAGRFPIACWGRKRGGRGGRACLWNVCARARTHARARAHTHTHTHTHTRLLACRAGAAAHGRPDRVCRRHRRAAGAL
jgi:hypothetical protein